MLLSGIRNWQQQGDFDCLVICCQTILNYLGIDKDEAWLWRQLSSGEITPFPNIPNLAAELGLTVEMGCWRDDLTLFGPYIELGLPVIVAVDAEGVYDEWPYYNDHAVVVVGFDDQCVFVNDPAQAEAPLEIGRELFLWAWSNREYEYAVIRLAADS